MEIRPQDLPELRAQLITDFRASQASASTEHHVHPHVASRTIDALTSSELFFVTRHMTALADAAAESLEVFTPQAEDMPSATGLLLFETSPASVAVVMDSGRAGSIRGVAWWMGSSSQIDLMPIMDCKHGCLHVAPGACFGVPLGEGALRLSLEGNGLNPYHLFTLLLSTWLIMNQPLAEAAAVEPDRPARRRLRREGIEPAAVRVIELRRPRGASGGDGTSNYHHQWIVRGHWRQHWHPKRQVHRPVWIAPHVKGPEGAPLIGGEKVYALKR